MPYVSELLLSLKSCCLCFSSLTGSYRNIQTTSAIIFSLYFFVFIISFAFSQQFWSLYYCFSMYHFCHLDVLYQYYSNILSQHFQHILQSNRNKNLTHLDSTVIPCISLVYCILEYLYIIIQSHIYPVIAVVYT